MSALCIIIPSKDRPGLLPVAVRSALDALPEGRGEVLVVDDASAPPAAECLSYISDSRLRVLVNPGPHGPAAARNFGVSQTSAETVLFLDDDDQMVPGYAEWVGNCRGSNPTVQYGYSDIHTFSGETTLPASFGADTISLSELPFRKQVAGLGCGFWVDRALFEKVGGIAEDLLVNEDTDFTIRLLASGATGCKATSAGVHVRAHDTAANLGHITQRTRAADRAGYFSKILDRNASWLNKHPEARKHIQKRLLKMQAKAGLWSEARQTLSLPGAAHLWPYFAINAVMYRLKS